MPFCSQCGTETDGAFCSKCGAPVGVAGGATASPAAAAGLQTNVAAALCYVLGLVTGIVFLVLPPYNQNRLIRFHAFQSIFVHLALIVVWIAGSMITAFLLVVLTALAGLFNLVVSLGSLLLWLFLMWKAYQGEKVVLPIIGPMAEQAAGK